MKVADKADTEVMERNRQAQRVPHVVRLAEAVQSVEDVGYALAPTGQKEIVAGLMLVAAEIERLAARANFHEVRN